MIRIDLTASLPHWLLSFWLECLVFVATLTGREVNVTTFAPETETDEEPK